MSILSKSSSDMSAAAAGVGGGSATSFLEFKKQASFFFKEKIKTARLALTDVTPAQLLTEEATSGNPWAPDPRTLGSISRAAFELDDYLRIVEILHKRLGKFERKNWRATYHSLILLERLLTHGPESVSREFLEDRHAIRDAQTFQHIDEKGFLTFCSNFVSSFCLMILFLSSNKFWVLQVQLGASCKKEIRKDSEAAGE
ncbi:Clathrin interactor 1 [Linum grandiflorum]